MDIAVAVAAGKPGVNLVRITGRLDAMTYEAAQPVIVDALDKSSEGIILSLGGMDFISSAGLRVMIIVSKQASSTGKKLAIIEAQPSIYKIFKISALDKIIRFFDSEGEALSGLWQ